MRRIGMVAAALPALWACTSTRMLQREGCRVKQAEKWPGRVSEELGFCSKPPPVWAQDRVARLVQECMAQADFRTGTAKTESDLRSSEQPPVQTAPATVVEVHGAPAQAAPPGPVVVKSGTAAKAADACAAARTRPVRRGKASKAPEPPCPNTAQPPSPVSLVPAGSD